MVDYLDTAPCGYLRFKDSGEITFINATLAGWVGYAKEELIGRNVEVIFTLATRIFYNTHFFPLLRLQSKAEEIFLSLLSRNNDDIPVIANADRSAIYESDVNQCIFIQVRQRRKFEDEILKAKREAEKALEENEHLQVLARSLEEQSLQLDSHLAKQIYTNENLLKLSKIISHDLQEPIRKVRLYTGMLQVRHVESLPEKAQSMLLKIQTAAERMHLLTTGLHEYLTIDEDRYLTKVNVLQVLHSATEKVKASRGIQVFDVTVEGMDILIEGYPGQVELMFIHLIDNAVKFRHPDRNPKVNVTLIELDENLYRSSKDKYKFSRHVRISLSDNGIGFEKQYNDYVFQMLNKLETGTKGVGLGLSLVKKVLENHHGHLKVTSTPGVGTTFKIDLPMALK